MAVPRPTRSSGGGRVGIDRGIPEVDTNGSGGELPIFGWAVDEGPRLAADGPGHGHGLPTVWP